MKRTYDLPGHTHPARRIEILMYKDRHDSYVVGEVLAENLPAALGLYFRKHLEPLGHRDPLRTGNVLNAVGPDGISREFAARDKS